MLVLILFECSLELKKKFEKIDDCSMPPVGVLVYFRNCKLQSCITILTVTDWLLLEKGSLQQLYSVDITRCLEGAVLSHLRYRCSANFIVKCKKCIFFANRFTLCGKPFKSFGCGNVSNKDFLKHDL